LPVFRSPGPRPWVLHHGTRVEGKDGRGCRLQREFSRIFNGQSEQVEPEEEGQGQDHQFGIQQDEDSGLVEAPTAAVAAGCLKHGPASGENGQNLPARAVRGFEVGIAGKAQAGGEGAECEQDAANERPLAEAEDGRARERHAFTLVVRSILRGVFDFHRATPATKPRLILGGKTKKNLPQKRVLAPSSRKAGEIAIMF